jgi:hypothetical protein
MDWIGGGGTGNDCRGCSQLVVIEWYESLSYFRSWEVALLM